jgi:hypothetical protein
VVSFVFLVTVSNQVVAIPDFAKIAAVSPENLIANKAAYETAIISPKLIALAMPEIGPAPGPQISIHDTHRTTYGSQTGGDT